MLINDVIKRTGLTKKAIEYYIQQDLVLPVTLENGYRDFSEKDTETLKRICVLRKLGLSTFDIKDVMIDDSKDKLLKLSLKKEMDLKRENEKKLLIEKLAFGEDYDQIHDELKAIEKNQTIAEKLLDSFPGYYGRFIFLHFSRFLNEPILTQKQKVAYDRIISFLDEMPALDFPDNLQEYINENLNNVGNDTINKIIDDKQKSFENIDVFLNSNKEMLAWYLEYKKSEEYLKSPACQLMSLMKKFNQTSGYNDVFIPALKELSTSYNEYSLQVEEANKKFIKSYPEVENWD